MILGYCDCLEVIWSDDFRQVHELVKPSDPALLNIINIDYLAQKQSAYNIVRERIKDESESLFQRICIITDEDFNKWQKEYKDTVERAFGRQLIVRLRGLT